MKRKLLLAVCTLLVGGNIAMAQEAPANDGIYYLYNQASGLFLTRGNNWGTRVVARPIGLPWKVTVENNAVKLQMYDLVTAGNANGFSTNVFSDSEPPVPFTLDGNATNGYTLKNGDNYVNCPSTAGDINLNTTSSTWLFLTQAQYESVLVAKVAAQESDIATKKGISIPTGQNLNDVVTNVNNWAVSATVNDGAPANGAWTLTGVPSRGGTQNWGDYGAEIFQGGGSYSKTISGLQPGIYKVAVRGLKRVGTNGNCVTMYNAGYPVSDAYLDANGYIIRIKSWAEDRVSDSNPNSTGEFVSAVNNNKYITEGFVYVGTDGKLVLNASSEAYWNSSWFLFNGISYTYYNNEVSNEDAAAILDQATTLDGQIMETSLQTALTTAKNTFDGSRTIENYNALGNAITNAQNSVNAYAKAKAYLDEAETVLAGTNVYTALAYATYYTEPKAKYVARTLTTEEANALVKTSNGWHTINTIDDILLSTWTIGGEQAKDYEKSLYINTWSVEGANDGSNFLAPFFEYWIEDKQSLGATTLVSTITGLKPNTTYSFTIRARVRQTDENEKIPNGITMQVGSGTAVDISSGTKFGTTPFYIGNFSAVGQTDADGVLTATITVAANSYISWLSFYNCKYTEGEDLSAYIEDYEFALTTATAANNNDAYAIVTGKEKADLQAAIDNYSNVDKTNKTALIAAKAALETASNAFVNAVAAYTNFSELNATVASTLGVTLPTISATTTAADLEKVIVDEYNAAKTNYINDVTGKLGDWTNAPGKIAGQSWDNSSNDEYYDLYNSAVRNMTQTVTLPAGGYALVAKGRASVNGRLTLSDGTETVIFPHKSDVGLGIDTNGDATFATDATYANGNGRGWEYRVLTFTSDGTNPITLTFNWTTANSNWCGLDDDIKLLSNIEEANMKIAAGKYATFCAPFDVTIPTGVTAYIVNGVEGETLNMTAVETTIPANTPVLLYSASDVDKTFSGEFVNGNPEAGLLTGVYSTAYIPEGSYVLQTQGGIQAFYLVDGASEINGVPNRAYLTLSNGVGAKERVLFLEENEDATLISVISALTTGEVEAIYSVGGAPLNGLQKGINIVKMRNGETKKVILK